MASSSDGAASAPNVQETGADGSYDRMGRIERLPSAQEQLLRTQLQQLGLEADDDAPLPVSYTHLTLPTILRV